MFSAVHRIKIAHATFLARLSHIIRVHSITPCGCSNEDPNRILVVFTPIDVLRPACFEPVESNQEPFSRIRELFVSRFVAHASSPWYIGGFKGLPFLVTVFIESGASTHNTKVLISSVATKTASVGLLTRYARVIAALATSLIGKAVHFV